MRSLWFLGLLLFTGSSLAALERPRQIALSGQLVDGQTGQFIDFQDGPVIGGHDVMAFGSSTTGGTLGLGLQIVTFRNGSLAPLVARSSPVPGESGLHFKNTEVPVIASDDTISFGADFDIPNNSFFYDGLFTTRPGGSIVPLIRTTDPAPGSGTFGTVFPPAALNPLGQAAFITSTGVFHVDPATGVVTRLSTGAAPTMNASGEIAMTGQSPVGVNAVLVGRPTDGSLHVRLSVNDQVSVNTVLGLSWPGINNHSDIVVTGQVRPAGSSATLGAMFVGSGDDVQVVARQSDAISPGSSLRFGAFYSGDLISVPVINASGACAVVAPLQTPAGAAAGQALFVRTPGAAMEPISVTGTTIPTSNGVFNLASFGTSNQISLNMNSLGQVAVMGYDSSGKAGLFAYDPIAGFRSVITAGETIALSDNSPRTIAGIRTCSTGWFNSGGEDGRQTCLSDSGLLVYKLAFTDGSTGIFATTVPEPTAMALVCAALISCNRRRAAIASGNARGTTSRHLRMGRSRAQTVACVLTTRKYGSAPALG